jgi:hypothetical protein
VGVDSVVDAPGEGGDRSFQLVVFECGDASAVVAEQVVMVVAAWVGGFVAGGAVTYVESLDEAELVEDFDGAVDAGGAGGGSLGTERVGDFAGREAAVLLGEDVDHGQTGGAAQVPGLLERVGCMRLPSRVGHMRMILGYHDAVPVGWGAS